MTIYDAESHTAEVYDTYETQTEDIELIRRLIGDSGPLRIREAFCGTGRILVPLALDGHVLTGSDISEVMLERARRKVQALPADAQSRITLKLEDAILTDWGSGFDLAILGANCFYELSSRADQAACIRRAAECLKAGGHAFVDNNARHGNVSESDIGSRSNYPTGTCEDGYRLEGTGEIVRVDTERNRWFKKRVLSVYDPSGQEASHREWETCTRPVSMEEVRGWLQQHGFEILELFGNRLGAPYTQGSSRAIFWARRAAP